MKIGIFGAGNIGGALGKHWADKGHDVLYGVRDPNSAKTKKALAESGPNARAASIADTAAFGEVLVLAVPATAAKDTLAAAGDLQGKLVIDTTNRFAAPAPDQKGSWAQTVAGYAKNGRVIKAFNTLPWEAIANPDFGGCAPTAFVCGDDADAKQTVIQLAKETGLNAVDAGPAENAALAEELTKFWAQIARNVGRASAFALLTR